VNLLLWRVTVRLSRSLTAVLLTWLVAGSGLAAQETKVNRDAKVLADFKDRVDKYMEQHNRLEKDAPRLKETKDAAQIKASQDVLATKIRAARATARQGDIFTPEIAQVFRRLMYPEVKGPEGSETKKAIKEDEPATIRLKVNAKYPEDQPLPTVPANLLTNLPKLPEDLEYRVVRNALILRDIHANLIVDFIPKAIR
jgi:hypothetical protein